MPIARRRSTVVSPRRRVIEGEVDGGEDLAVHGKVDRTIELPQDVSDGPRGQPWSPRDAW